MITNIVFMDHDPIVVSKSFTRVGVQALDKHGNRAVLDTATTVTVGARSGTVTIDQQGQTSLFPEGSFGVFSKVAGTIEMVFLSATAPQGVDYSDTLMLTFLPGA